MSTSIFELSKLKTEVFILIKFKLRISSSMSNTLNPSLFYWGLSSISTSKANKIKQMHFCTKQTEVLKYKTF